MMIMKSKKKRKQGNIRIYDVQKVGEIRQMTE